MSLSLSQYRTKLITKVLLASSQHQVKRYIDTAAKSLAQNKLHGHIVTRFIDKMLDELESVSPMDLATPQWSNIQMARVCLNLVKRKMEKVPA